MAALSRKSSTHIVENVMDVTDIFDENLTFVRLLSDLNGDDTLTAIKWLATRRMLHNSWACPHCGTPCRLVRYSKGQDRWRWKCSAHNFAKSIRTESFFENSHISLKNLIIIMFMWANDFPKGQIMRETGLSNKTILEWCDYHKEIGYNPFPRKGIWQYYFKIDQLNAKCLQPNCNKIIKTTCGNTSGLHKHQTNIHKVESLKSRVNSDNAFSLPRRKNIILVTSSSPPANPSNATQQPVSTGTDSSEKSVTPKEPVAKKKQINSNKVKNNSQPLQSLQSKQDNQKKKCCTRVKTQKASNRVVVANQSSGTASSTFTITNIYSCTNHSKEKNTPTMSMKTVENSARSFVLHKHQSHILTNVTNLWKKGKLCDASIGNGTMKIMVHKVVLIALCPKLLTLPNINVTTKCFQLTFSQNVGGDALWAFAKYMYEGVVSLNEEVLVDMEHIAKILVLADLSDMCKLYRKQVLSSVTSSVTTEALNSPSIEPPSIMRDAISTDSLSKTDGPSLSTGVSFMELPDQDITPTISKSVQQLQKIATESMTNPIQFQTNESVVPVNLYTADQDSSVSSYAEDSVRLKHEPTSPLKKRCNKKGFLPSFPSRHSDPHIVVHDDLSEPWQPKTYCDNEDLQSPPPPKRLKSSEHQEDSLCNLSHSNTEDFSPQSTKDSYPIKIELDQDNSDLEVSEIPYVVSLIENKGLDSVDSVYKT
ncbi:uncharacterized protein LOC115230799 [Argonauta hians]